MRCRDPRSCSEIGWTAWLSACRSYGSRGGPARAGPLQLPCKPRTRHEIQRRRTPLPPRRIFVARSWCSPSHAPSSCPTTSASTATTAPARSTMRARPIVHAGRRHAPSATSTSSRRELPPRHKVISCETCHGPLAKHASGDDAKVIAAGRHAALHPLPRGEDREARALSARGHQGPRRRRDVRPVPQAARPAASSSQRMDTTRRDFLIVGTKLLVMTAATRARWTTSWRARRSRSTPTTPPTTGGR